MYPIEKKRQSRTLKKAKLGKLACILPAKQKSFFQFFFKEITTKHEERTLKLF
jgi:hypothetical protein